MTSEDIVEQILHKRGVGSGAERHAFLNPNYEEHTHDPYLLAGMKTAVKRLLKAQEQGEKVVIYGDYDIDGLTATTLLMDAFHSFGLNVEPYIPDRFVEGYGLNAAALSDIKSKHGAQVVVTVDCGGVSFAEAKHAREIGLDLIITDHHTMRFELPEALAVINPKRQDSKYPFSDLAGVGVAFKLVQAMQLSPINDAAGSGKKLLPLGQEKWLLDLVALGTVCDVVELQDENRALVYWGLKVMRQTKRPGIQELMRISGTDPNAIRSTDLGFRLGPRLNAAGRLEHARHSLDLLRSEDVVAGAQHAEFLHQLNSQRRQLQQRIIEEAHVLAAGDDRPVLVLAQKNWSQGVVGIVAAKIMEHYSKPTFIMEVIGDKTKGSARSFGGFSAVEAIRTAQDFMISGGGHAAAGGVTIKTEDIDRFRETVNRHYQQLRLDFEQEKQLLKPMPEVKLRDFTSLTPQLLTLLGQLEPFGRHNEEPLFEIDQATVVQQRFVGQQQNHLKLELADNRGQTISAIAFNRTTKAPINPKAVIARLSPTNYHPRGVDLQIVQIK